MSEIWPKGVAKPAIRALHAVGYRELKQLANVEIVTLQAMHGMGPKAISAIQEALKQMDLSLKE